MSTSGLAAFEMLVGVLLVFALLLGILVLVTSEGSGTEENYSVSPYRAMYATYLHNRLNEWSTVIQGFKEQHGVLPGDSPQPPNTDSEGRAVGNGNGRVERDKGENRKFFNDLFVSGLASEPLIRVRGKVMDFYWADLGRNGTGARPGHYMKLPNIHRDEALALDHKYDDRDRTSGTVLYFDNPDGTVDVFIQFTAY
jgi:hypothetical protein